MKNKHFRELESWRYTEGILTTEFRLFVENEIWPKLKTLHTGYRLKEKKDITAQIIHQLVETGLTNKVVADSRDNSGKKTHKRIPIWDAITKKKLCKVCKGSESSHQVTRYRATGRLLELRERWELKLLEDLDLKRNTELVEPTSHALVVLYSGKTDWLTGRTLLDEQRKKPQSIQKHIEATCQRDANDIRKPDPQALQNGLDYFREIENIINKINKENLSHSWFSTVLNEKTGNLLASPVNICLRQIHSGQLFRGTRLYSWGAASGQGLSKEQRQTIQIDNEPAAEFDSSCHAIRLAYHLNHIDERGDCYWPERVFVNFYSFKNIAPKAKEIVRDFVKTCTNIALNNQERTIAIMAIGKQLRDDKNYDFLNNLIFKTEKTNLNGILENIIKAHPEKVSEKFFSKVFTDYGMDLMRTDGLIMLHTLTEFVAERQKPALAIHDSLVVKKSDIEEAMDVYSENYYKFTQRKPVLNLVF